MSICDKSAIVGLANTEFSKNSGRSELQLAAEAVRDALDDAGLKPSDVDGMTTFTMDNTDEIELARAVGIGDITFYSRVPHGGGAVPYHWGRFRGLADMMKLDNLNDIIRDHIYFDTCVYHQEGIDLLVDVIPTENILFASEMVGAVRGIDPQTGHYFDDTKRYIDGCKLSDEGKQQVFETNARKVFPRLDARLKAVGLL